MIYFFIIIVSVSFFMLALPYKKAYGWHGKKGLIGNCPDYTDVHYCDTKAWCMEEGMAEVFADKVGYSCTLVDAIHALDSGWHFNTSITNNEDSRDIFHWQEYSRSFECLNEAGWLMEYILSCSANQTAIYLEMAERLKGESLIHLGYSLHPLQDKYAHMAAGYGGGNTWIKHGEIGIVNVLDADGSCRGTKVQGDLFDDVDYDFYGDKEGYPFQGQWYYLDSGGKYKNSRWQHTRHATKHAIRSFLEYGEAKNIYFQ